jgi:hypothetical protein
MALRKRAHHPVEFITIAMTAEPCCDGARTPDPPQRADRNVAALRTHEAVCAERYANLLSLLEATTKRVGRLEVLIVIVAGSVICGMGGIIFTLALKLGTH